MKAKETRIRQTSASGRKRSTKIRFGISTDHEAVNRCLAYMEENFCEPIRLKDLVEISSLSWRGFHKAFVKNVGVNPGKLLRAIRIEHAKRLLITDDLNLKEIASRCGFRSDNTLCVAFVREVKMPPKKFQRQYWSALSRQLQHNRTLMPLVSKRAPFPLNARASDLIIA